MWNAIRAILRWRRWWEIIKLIARIIIEYGPIIIELLKKLFGGRGGGRAKR